MGTIFSNTLETVAPIKLKKVREKRAAPWYNSYTHSLKKETRILERKWRKSNLEVFRIAWKNIMSSYRQALKTARTEYIRKLIDNHQNNPRFLFSTVARLTNKQMSPDLNIPSQFNSNDFMNFFTDKIDNIRNTITNVDSTASSTPASLIAPKEKLQCFTTIGQEELNKLITASKPTTCLLDPVPTKLLKELLPVAEQPLLNIINSSLSLGHVPKPFKLAVIKPLIKKPKLDPCELANYRPISNLPFMSKLLEKVVSAQLCSFLQKNDIYEEFQSGFRPRHSTETALVKIKNDLLLASDKGCISLLVLLDLSAAFDTIDHDILIDRLQNYTGIQGQALRWFRSYLSDRYHIVYLTIFSSGSQRRRSLSLPVLTLIFPALLPCLVRDSLCTALQTKILWINWSLNAIDTMETWVSGNLTALTERSQPAIRWRVGEVANRVSCSSFRGGHWYLPIRNHDNRYFADWIRLFPGLSKNSENGNSCPKPHKAARMIEAVGRAVSIETEL